MGKNEARNQTTVPVLRSVRVIASVHVAGWPNGVVQIVPAEYSYASFVWTMIAPFVFGPYGLGQGFGSQVVHSTCQTKGGWHCEDTT